MSSITSDHGMANFSLTDMCLKSLDESNHRGIIFSFTVVHIGGSLSTLATTTLDTIIQLAMTTLKLITSLVVSPVNFCVAPFTKWRFARDWGLTAACQHLSQAVKHFLAQIPIFLMTFFASPATTRNVFFKDSVQTEQFNKFSNKAQSEEQTKEKLIQEMHEELSSKDRNIGRNAQQVNFFRQQLEEKSKKINALGAFINHQTMEIERLKKQVSELNHVIKSHHCPSSAQTTTILDKESKKQPFQVSLHSLPLKNKVPAPPLGGPASGPVSSIKKATTSTCKQNSTAQKKLSTPRKMSNRNKETQAPNASLQTSQERNVKENMPAPKQTPATAIHQITQGRFPMPSERIANNSDPDFKVAQAALAKQLESYSQLKIPLAKSAFKAFITGLLAEIEDFEGETTQFKFENIQDYADFPFFKTVTAFLKTYPQGLPFLQRILDNFLDADKKDVLAREEEARKTHEDLLAKDREIALQKKAEAEQKFQEKKEQWLRRLPVEQFENLSRMQLIKLAREMEAPVTSEMKKVLGINNFEIEDLLKTLKDFKNQVQEAKSDKQLEDLKKKFDFWTKVFLSNLPRGYDRY